MSIQRSLIAFATVFAASTSACYAGPCSQDIARLAAAWDAKLAAAAARPRTPASGPLADNLSRQKLNRAFTQLDGIALALLCQLDDFPGDDFRYGVAPIG